MPFYTSHNISVQYILEYKTSQCSEPCPSTMSSSSPYAQPPSGPRPARPGLEDLLGLHDTYVQYPELKNLPNTASTLARAIVRLPVVRGLDLRPGFALGKSLKNPSRPWNLEVSLAYMRGDSVRFGCDHCLIRNEGPFSQCVVLEGRFQGSCTNCHYNNHGERCTLRGMVSRSASRFVYTSLLD